MPHLRPRHDWAMTADIERARSARQIIDTTQYMVLATADASGRPWASPVWFAHRDYREFVWVSSPAVRHSRNIAERPQVGVVIFNSQVPIGTGQGVYLSCVATVVPDSELGEALEVFNYRSLASGGEALARTDVQGPASEFRLYRAVADEAFMLAKDGQPDHRVPIQLTP